MHTRERLATRQARWAVLVGAALAAAGCGGEPVGVVVGKVTLDGAPVTDATISFVPTNGMTVTTTIHPDGSYRAENVPAGVAIVTVVPIPGGGDEAAIHKSLKETAGKAPPPSPAKRIAVPTRYTDPATSDLRHTVQKGENVYDVPLKK
jgi:hypothetical protein